MKVSGYSTLVVCLTGLRIIIGGKGCGHFIWLDKWINQYPERVNDNGDHIDDEVNSERNIPPIRKVLWRWLFGIIYPPLQVCL